MKKKCTYTGHDLKPSTCIRIFQKKSACIVLKIILKHENENN